MSNAEDLEIKSVHKTLPGVIHNWQTPVVQVRHKPTGITVEVGVYRTQHLNVELAMEMFEWALIATR